MNNYKGIKKIIMLIKERIYFKDLHDHRKYGTIVLTGNTFTIKDDMVAYHEYYMNNKKAV